MTLPWIVRTPGVPYFSDETGAAWTPVGQNDAISWVELAGLYRRRDLPGVAAHLRHLRAHGVTCLRLMLEYFQTDHRLFERQVGVWNPDMVRLWDDLFALCEQTGMRILLTPFDTFFTWIRFSRHPYHRRRGGPCPSRTRLLTHAATREAIRARFAFATGRWGGSGALFAWDLWNEMHPAQGNDEPDAFDGFISDIGPWLRAEETRLHGRAHLQCVSVFGPELRWKPWLNAPIFRHPALDFASSHFYEEGTIDHPGDTVAPAIAVGRLVDEAIAEIADDRPFLDSEHGPIHTFKDKHRTLPAAFDDEYFRHIQWAHLASGGAGGGMRWPNRKPHVLTPGMRQAQRALTGFLPLVDWTRFRRRRLEGVSDDPGVVAFGCGDGFQAVVFLLRRALSADGRVDASVVGDVGVRIPGLEVGTYRAVVWDTRVGAASGTLRGEVRDGVLMLTVPALGADAALAVRAD